ncbi:hypothetical protein ACFY8O_27800 [Streptomyces argenteolus]|uniref:Uncharacterized protein n=1 Tax=Streptomyces argenteolus TaxID=67274 RepID=A0ABW6XD83_9ACTN
MAQGAWQQKWRGELTTGAILLGRAALPRERPELLPRLAQAPGLSRTVVAAVTTRTGLCLRTTAALLRRAAGGSSRVGARFGR